MPPEDGRLERPKTGQSASVVEGLSPEFAAMIQGCFSKMDNNGDGSITRTEAKRFFRSFGGLCADAMFHAVDEDSDNTITLDEFLAYWASVKRSGYTEEDLLEEIGELFEGNAWVQFDKTNSESYGYGGE